MCPELASRKLEISTSTTMSVKFLASRSRMRTVSSVTDQTRRSGIRLNCNCVVIRYSNLWPEKFSIYLRCNKKAPRTYPRSDHRSLDATWASVPRYPRDRPGRPLPTFESTANIAPSYLFHASGNAHHPTARANRDTPWFSPKKLRSSSFPPWSTAPPNLPARAAQTRHGSHLSARLPWQDRLPFHPSVQSGQIAESYIRAHSACPRVQSAAPQHPQAEACE